MAELVVGEKAGAGLHARHALGLGHQRGHIVTQMQEILQWGVSRLTHIKMRSSQIELTAGISHMQVKRSPNDIA